MLHSIDKPELLTQTTVCGAKLSLLTIDYKTRLFFEQKFGLSAILASVLYNRKYNESSIENFLSPRIKNSLPDPFLLLGMKEAIARIIYAIDNQEKIVVYGDYDVDGATSSALLKNYFKELGVIVDIYIPDRIEEGYGPNSQAFLKLKQASYSLCITVDCGIVAFNEIKFAKENGLDIIIIDHHISAETLPEAVAIVNPNRIDQEYISGTENLAAVSVSFLVIIALTKQLKENNFFQGQLIPDLMEFLDLVALGTVCDIVKLTEINRALVATGLKIIKKKKNLGLRALIEQLGIKGELTAYTLGYIIGPHINAGGRISKSSLGSRLLSSNDEEEALEIALQLKVLNIKRKEIEKAAFEEALQQVICVKQKFVMVQSSNWHPGVIGIVASRLKEHFHLPTIVISSAQSSSNIGKASCRSIAGTNLGAAVLEAKIAGLIIEGGGHKMAAGFSVELNKIKDLTLFFKEKFLPINTERTIKIDDEITLAAITIEFCQELEKLQPFGMGNSEPIFLLKNIKIINPSIIKEEHISCLIYDSLTNKSMRAVAFKAANNSLGQHLINPYGTNKSITKLIIKVKPGYWQGRLKAEIIIEDACC